jgi:MATE family multidrug resistance protein
MSCPALFRHPHTFFSSTDLAEYSFVVVSVMCIGHISTLALAAATLGSMTAAVTGYSIVQGFGSTLETLLPSAWTSDRPHMVGLWTQRMGWFFLLHSP